MRETTQPNTGAKTRTPSHPEKFYPVHVSSLWEGGQSRIALPLGPLLEKIQTGPLGPAVKNLC